MKAEIEHISWKTTDSSVRSYRMSKPRFRFKWHYHPEFELTFIEKGMGTRFVGDQVEDYGPGDFVLLGSGLPHTWCSEEGVTDEPDSSRAVVFQFPPERFNRDLLDLPEMSRIQWLLRESGRGFAFEGDHALEVGRELIDLSGVRGIRRLTGILELLDRLAGVKRRPLASPTYSASAQRPREDRMDRVFNFIHDRYTGEIALEEAAEQANLSVSAFCRFFRRATGTTFTAYLADLRVGRACKLLIERGDDIANIAYAAGFGSLTHFNRTFRSRKGMTPREYREHFSRRRTLQAN